MTKASHTRSSTASGRLLLPAGHGRRTHDIFESSAQIQQLVISWAISRTRIG